VVVVPHWFVEPDAQGRWSVQMQLSIDTTAAESRRRTTERIGVGV
jgi:4-alpha-glucanotransferase